MADKIVIRGITCVMTDCITCGVPFTVPLGVYEEHVRNGGYHHCPNGHSQGWDKSNSQRERDRRELESLRQQKARYEDEVREQRERAEVAERRASAAKGQLTKLKKRTFENGVCPCCTRSFENLRRHMKTKHPEFVADAPYNVVPLKVANA